MDSNLIQQIKDDVQELQEQQWQNRFKYIDEQLKQAIQSVQNYNLSCKEVIDQALTIRRDIEVRFRQMNVKTYEMQEQVTLNDIQLRKLLKAQAQLDYDKMNQLYKQLMEGMKDISQLQLKYAQYDAKIRYLETTNQTIQEQIQKLEEALKMGKVNQYYKSCVEECEEEESAE